MNNLYVLSFSARGCETAERLAAALDGQAFRVCNLEKQVEDIFKKGNVLVFIGAAGIALRAVAPHLRGKTLDPPVIVMDEAKQFVIPILSGHVGGANAYAKKIAEVTGAIPVITTATDVNNVFAVDTFAVNNGYHIVNPEMIKWVSGALLENKAVGLHTLLPVEGALPDHIVSDRQTEIGIYIGEEEKAYPFNRTLHLCPKRFHVGIGARKNTDCNAMNDFFIDLLKKHKIPVWAVGSLSSIDIKKEEEAIVNLSRLYNIRFITYTVDELSRVNAQFVQSDFVKKVTGAGNICEASAHLSAGEGRMVVGKTKKDGMTMAVAEEAWTVRFV